jgi:3-oxoacyl-[acyl-carrier protein] reductase
MDVTGKIALVTGAAAGIGRASALALAGRGAGAVVVADIDLAGAEATAEAVRALGADALAQATDVSDPVALRALFAGAEAHFGGIDIVHNNAGLVSGDPPWPDTPLDVVEQVIKVNVLGTFVGTRLAIDALRRRGGGAVVNTASVAGLAPMPTDAVYAATKAAIILFTQSCGGLRESDGIRVNAVLPGIVDTPMLAKTGDGSAPAAWLAPLLDLIEILTPDAVAAAVVDLVEDDTKAGQTVMLANSGKAPAA